MKPSSNRFGTSRLQTESEPVVYTDNGSGLLEACRTRFMAPEYEVMCDAWHTVWVKRQVGTRSFGLSPWLLRDHSMNEVLDSAEAKLRPSSKNVR